jgi:hypothetical protein
MTSFSDSRAGEAALRRSSLAGDAQRSPRGCISAHRAVPHTEPRFRDYSESRTARKDVICSDDLTVPTGRGARETMLTTTCDVMSARRSSAGSSFVPDRWSIRHHASSLYRTPPGPHAVLAARAPRSAGMGPSANRAGQCATPRLRTNFGRDSPHAPGFSTLRYAPVMVSFSTRSRDPFGQPGVPRRRAVRRCQRTRALATLRGCSICIRTTSSMRSTPPRRGRVGRR